MSMGFMPEINLRYAMLCYAAIKITVVIRSYYIIFKILNKIVNRDSDNACTSEKVKIEMTMNSKKRRRKRDKVVDGVVHCTVTVLLFSS